MNNMEDGSWDNREVFALDVCLFDGEVCIPDDTDRVYCRKLCLRRQGAHIQPMLVIVG